LVVGRLQTSPKPKMFLYLLCLNVSLSTSNKKLDSFVAKPDSTKLACGFPGGRVYKLLYGFITLSFVLTFSNTAN